MKNNFKKIIVLSLVILCFSIFVNSKVEASTIILKPSSNMVGIGEQFYVDVMLDTNGKIINGFDGLVNFPLSNFSFIRAEEGSSIISFWIEKPTLKGNEITFSGIIPNGFSGVIDPFNPNKRLSGLMTRLVFEAKKEGVAKISLFKSYTTLNDGLGTIDNIPDVDTLITIQNSNNPFIYKSQNDVEPELSAFITRTPDLFNNKYALIFDARDAQTGIKEVLIKEGSRTWKKIESPYLLEDQSRHSIITLQATNYSDSSIVINIESVPYKIFSIRNIIIILLFIILLLFISRKIYEKYK